MLILGLEAATCLTSVALARDETLLAEYTYGGPSKPSQVLMVLVDRALNDAGIQRGQLEALAVGSGPGSFTGLRLGLGTAKGLAYALSIPVVGISTLEAMAAPWLPVLSADQVVVPMLWAQRNLVYTASYRAGGSEGVPPRCMAWEALLAELVASEYRMVVVGEWAWERREEIRARVGGKAEVAAPVFAFPRASVVIQLGRRRLQVAGGNSQVLHRDPLTLGSGDPLALRSGDPRGLRSGDPLALRPTYLRKSEAEERWEERHGSTA